EGVRAASHWRPPLRRPSRAGPPPGRSTRRGRTMIDMSKARLVWHHGGQGEVTGLTYRGRTDIAARYAGTDVWIDGHRVHTSAVRQMVGDVDVLLRAGGA